MNRPPCAFHKSQVPPKALPPPSSFLLFHQKKKKKAPISDSNTFPLALCSMCPGTWGEGGRFPPESHPKQSSMQGELCGLNCGPHTWFRSKPSSSSAPYSPSKLTSTEIPLGSSQLWHGGSGKQECMTLSPHTSAAIIFPPPTSGL